jgi:membrane protease YdiL (CAAX protease family)
MEKTIVLQRSCAAILAPARKSSNYGLILLGNRPAMNEPLPGLSAHTGPTPQPLERPPLLLAWAAVSVLTGSLAADVTSLAVATRTAAPKSATALFAAIAMDCFLLLGVFWHFKIVAPPGKDLKKGFGFYRLQRWRLLFALAALVLVIDGTWGYIALRPQFSWTPEMLPLEQTIAFAGPTAQAGWFAVTTLLTPIAEEVFFRGWLWTSLRRFWTPFTVMAVTGLGWVAPHMLGSANTALRLLPLAVILGLARHFCRSVSASIGLHALNNACVCIALLLYGSG